MGATINKGTTSIFAAEQVVTTDIDYETSSEDNQVIGSGDLTVTLTPSPKIGETKRLTSRSGTMTISGGVHPLSVNTPTTLSAGSAVDLSFDGEKWAASASSANARWAAQGTWYVDAVNGDDLNDGDTALTAIKTFAELNRRWGSRAVLTGGVNIGGPLLAVVVNVLTDMPLTDPFRADVFLPQDTMLVIEGTVQSSTPGSVTAVTALNRGTNQAWEITPDIALNVGDRLRVTSGARTGQMAWVAKDLGAGVYRISQPSNIGPQLLAFLGLSTAGSFAMSDPFVVETLPEMALGDINVCAQLGAPPRPCISFRSVKLAGSSSALDYLQLGNAFWLFKGCYFSLSVPVVGAGTTQQWLTNCQLDNGTFTCLVGGKFCILIGGLCRGSAIVMPGGAVAAGADWLVQGPGDGTSALISNEGGHMILGSVGVFDSGGAGVRVGGQQFNFIGGAPGAFGWIQPGLATVSSLYGKDNADVGVAVSSGSKLGFGSAGKTTFAFITGTNGDFSLGGALVARAWDDAAGAYTEAGGAATRVTSWANLAAAIGGGGFDGSAHNVQKDASIVDLTDL